MPQRTFLPFAAFCFSFLCPLAGAFAQEADCTVQVNYEAVATTNKELLRDLANDIREYVSHFNWGGANTTDKVKCTLDIFVQSVVGENRYAAQMFVGSQRPIFKAGQNTAVVRLLDDSWEFTYIKDRPISHNNNTFNDLASFLDFYMFLVMGFDADTYDRMGGAPLFQKAADIASLGRSSSQKGWQPSTGGYSRIQLMDELLNPKFAPVRAGSYVYHFNGLDSLSFNKDRAFANILLSLSMIEGVKKEADPRNVLIKAFFETKYLELAKIFSDYPDPSVYLTLARIDPLHQAAYEESRTKRK